MGVSRCELRRSSRVTNSPPAGNACKMAAAMKDRSAEVLPPPLQEAVAKGATVRAFHKNAIIVNEGDETDSLYVILSGRARVYVSSPQGREVQLNVIGPGEYFGEVTLDGGPRAASVMALEGCRSPLAARNELLTLARTHRHFPPHTRPK